MTNHFKTVDEYILQFAPEIQEKLQQLRKTILEAAPEAIEKISWQMPTFTLNGNLVHFAAHKNHIGLYPGPSGIEAFQGRFGSCKSSKGAVQFPIKDPLPLDLISEIVRFRALENTKED
ncbi:hypothetical protein FRZ06_07185 [Anoxybacterium hadale]|uniref:Uncharacterized protein n=1 Tax=Anoxybacterium hadale TaxID=3408580 RepID=A0ACD1A9I4_9FIRM|nr:hypothetical protein FRZ06_07185 [Clostridiales bacterium]